VSAPTTFLASRACNPKHRGNETRNYSGCQRSTGAAAILIEVLKKDTIPATFLSSRTAQSVSQLENCAKDQQLGTLWNLKESHRSKTMTSCRNCLLLFWQTSTTKEKVQIV